jgi:Cu+-exporting ATPase
VTRAHTEGREFRATFTCATHTSEDTMVKDPVCKMQIDENKAAGKSEYKGTTYYFCAQSCKAKFDANPQQYVKA